MDIIVELPEPEECHTILTVEDQLMKKVLFIPCAHLHNTKDTAHLLITHIPPLWPIRPHILRLEFPVQISVLAGDVSPVNQVLEQYLRYFTNYHQNDWALLLPTRNLHTTVQTTPLLR